MIIHDKYMEENLMIEIRFHGRGGQGSVTAAEILAKAAFKDGKYSQAFPFFGVELRGAKGRPFKRIDDSKLKYEVPEKYRDNSYAAYLKQTGDNFGKAANDKLIVTRGKGFRKEKTKFKNKTFHGGVTISTTVRSIPLEDDSSED